MADPCAKIRGEVEKLRNEKKRIEDEMQQGHPGPGRKQELMQKVRQTIGPELDRKERELRQCEERIIEPGVFVCDDGGLYYTAEVGGNVYWFGERKDGSFATVIVGQKSGSQISGRWFDVPKGSAQSSGEIVISTGEFGNFELLSETGGFRGRTWKPYRPYVNKGLKAGSAPQEAKFTRGPTDWKTGAWTCTDGGTYYLRQLGPEIAWFGEGPGFSNVFLGRLTGDEIVGSWADVPKGKARSAGTLRLRSMPSPAPGVSVFERVAETGGFGGREWHRGERYVPPISETQPGEQPGQPQPGGGSLEITLLYRVENRVPVGFYDLPVHYHGDLTPSSQPHSGSFLASFDVDHTHQTQMSVGQVEDRVSFPVYNLCAGTWSVTVSSKLGGGSAGPDKCKVPGAVTIDAR